MSPLLFGLWQSLLKINSIQFFSYCAKCQVEKAWFNTCLDMVDELSIRIPLTQRFVMVHLIYWAKGSRSTYDSQWCTSDYVHHNPTSPSLWQKAEYQTVFGNRDINSTNTRNVGSNRSQASHTDAFVLWNCLDSVRCNKTIQNNILL